MFSYTISRYKILIVCFATCVKSPRLDVCIDVSVVLPRNRAYDQCFHDDSISYIHSIQPLHPIFPYPYNSVEQSEPLFTLLRHSQYPFSLPTHCRQLNTPFESTFLLIFKSRAYWFPKKDFCQYFSRIQSSL